MSSITRLQPSKNSKSRIHVHIDGGYAFSLPADKASALSVGQELSADDVSDLRRLALSSRALERALRFLTYRPRSRQEIERYLEQKLTPADICVETVERLGAMGLVDDAAFAQWWVDNRSRNQPRGPWALRRELAERGVDDRLIADVMSGLDEKALAERLAIERAGKYAGLDREVFRRRLGAVLLRRGFGSEIARNAVDRAWSEVGESASDD